MAMAWSEMFINLTYSVMSVPSGLYMISVTLNGM